MAKKLFAYRNFFCWNCGERIKKNENTCPYCQVKYEGSGKYGKVDSFNSGGLGWSKDANHKSFKKYYRKVKLLVLIWLIGLTVVVPSFLLLSGDVILDAEGKRVIKTVVLMFWIIGGLFQWRGFNKADWEGVVESKEIIDKKSSKVFIVNVRRENGKLKKIKETNRPKMFNYLEEGEKIYYHGKKHLNYIEKYNKNKDGFIPCLCCGNQANPRDNFCVRCGCKILRGV